MKTCDLVIDNEVIAYLKGLDTETRRQLSNEFSYFIPSARFTPAYKLGRWNGKVNFFEIGGRTYVGLLDQILPIIIEKGYEINLVDHRPSFGIEFDSIDENFLSHKTWPKGHIHEGEPISLRDYQVQIPNALFDNHQGIICASTGSGKTLITAVLSMKIEQYGRSMIIVPSKHLVKQTAEDYENLGLDYGVYYGDEKTTDAKHTICTWQSLEAAFKKKEEHDNLEKIVDGTVGVINDECFSSDTPILTKNGYVPISDIKKGDIVINYNEKHDLFKEDEVIKVHENLINSSSENMYELTFDNGKTIKVTGNHKLLTRNRGWVRADQLLDTDDVTELVDRTKKDQNLKRMGR